MTDKKIIAVLGATGAQGGGLVRAIQEDTDGGFTARAITRNAGSDAAKALADLGAEVVEANLDDAESLARAFRGAYGAFCVTFFWDHFSAEREMAEAKLLADTAKQEGLQHVIWSTLEDTRKFVPLDDPRMPTLQGKYKVPHFDGKGAADAYFTDAGVPTTFLLTTFYWDNLVHFGMNPKPDGSGKYAFTLPMANARLAGIAAHDIGKSAYGVFKEGAPLIGQYVGVSGNLLTGAQMADVLTDVLGVPVYHNSPSFDEYRAYGFPGADDLGNMFQFYHDFETHFATTRDPAIARRLNPELQNFRAWADENKARIPLT